MRPSLALLMSSRGVYVRLPIIRHLGSGSAAIMLAQIVWLLAETPDAEIVRGDHEWDQDTGLTARQARRARETLVTAGVITVNKRRVDGAPTSCIRLHLDGLDRLMTEAGGEPVDTREVRGETFRPNGQISFDQTGGTTSIREEVQIEASRSAPDAFERFWNAYPRKVDKRAALKAWKSAVKRADPSVIIRGATFYATHVEGSDPKFVKYPATWLNADAWLNEYDDPNEEPRVVEY